MFQVLADEIIVAKLLVVVVISPFYEFYSMSGYQLSMDN